MKKYNPSQVEQKWQKFWLEHQLFSALDTSEKPKKYILMEFPFPSGDGLHMGHVRGYTAADVVARYYRMQGFNVLYPIGWDAFGLPAENYALQHGKHPTITTAQNISNIKKQFLKLGYSFDWDREINTTDPQYYKWTQWLFLQFYKAGLAYEATGLINWCPKDKTGLANEEVINGECERCRSKVEKKELRQWYLKITAYAEQLLSGLENLPNWPESVKLQQKNWIGKSMGAEIKFLVKDSTISIGVFTTRPDTIFGATYLVLAPEHSLITSLPVQNFSEVQQYILQAKAKSEQDRMILGTEKTGVLLGGVVVINPANGQEMPVWIADYVLQNYGTGAVMAVPAHDERDFDFATKYNLPIIKVVENKQDLPSISGGILVNSGKFTGHYNTEVLEQMAEEYGKTAINYKLRDWVFSRQRYWGEPIPMIHCDFCGLVPVPENQLPVLLPDVKDYEPTGTGESPLAGILEWVNTTCPKCNQPAKRETNTMPQWAGSSWYYLRYLDPKNDQAFADLEKQRHWMAVDIYFGGLEHTTLHLLYSRFWNIFLFEQGLVSVGEPYIKRVPHGIILAENGEKMSKSKGNVVNPDLIVKEYGADAMRMYELFLGPHSASIVWNDRGIIGVKRFLDRVWYWICTTKFGSDATGVSAKLTSLIRSVTNDIESHNFNTVISSLMQFHNDVKAQTVSKETAQVFLQLLYPAAPHICEELYGVLGGQESLQYTKWPQGRSEEALLTEQLITVQINGKVRSIINAPAGADEAMISQIALTDIKIKTFLDGKTPARIIYVAGRLINFVIK